MAFTKQLPNNYLLNNRLYRVKIPDLVPISWVYNIEEPIDSGVTFTDLRLGVIDCFDNSLIIPEVDGLFKVDLPNGYRLYTDEVKLTGLDYDGAYHFIVYNIIDSTVLYIDKPFQFVETASGLCEVSYRNSTTIFNIDYQLLPAGYRQVVFLDLNVIGTPSEFNIENYTEQTSGLERKNKADFKDIVSLEATFFDKFAHEGMKGLVLHDDILINRLPYQSTPEGYEVELNRRDGVYVGSADFYIQDNNEINLYG